VSTYKRFAVFGLKAFSPKRSFDFVFAFQRGLISVDKATAKPPPKLQLLHCHGFHAAHKEGYGTVFPKAFQMQTFAALDVAFFVAFLSHFSTL
jgi:hypothetical protein